MATPWIALWCVCLGLCVAVAPLRHVRPAHLRLLAPVVAFVTLYAIVLLAHTAPGLPARLGAPVWREAAALLQEPLPARGGVSTYQPWLSVGAPLAFALAFAAGFLCSTDRTGAKIVLRGLAVVGLAQALVALAWLLWDHADVLFSEKAGDLGVPAGPFVNRNTNATYFGSCAVLWFAFMFGDARRHLTEVGLPLAEFGQAILEKPPWRLAGSAAAFVVTLTACFLTQSRAGVLFTSATLVFCGGVFAYRAVTRGGKVLLAVGGGLLLGGVLIEVLGGRFALRLGSEGLFDAQRYEVYRSTLAIIRDHPFGTGLGTFEQVFPAYRSERLPLVGSWDLAHSTPLELAAEMGLPVLAAAAALWLYVGIRLLRGVVVRRREPSLPLAALGVGLLGTLHSAVDFPLQIPGYAIFFAAIVGAGLAQSIRSRSPGDAARQTFGSSEARPVRMLAPRTTEAR